MSNDSLSAAARQGVLSADIVRDPSEQGPGRAVHDIVDQQGDGKRGAAEQKHHVRSWRISTSISAPRFSVFGCHGA